MVREVYGGRNSEKYVTPETGWQETLAPSEIAAVASGRKPIFHEHLGESADALVKSLKLKLQNLEPKSINFFPDENSTKGIQRIAEVENIQFYRTENLLPDLRKFERETGTAVKFFGGNF